MKATQRTSPAEPADTASVAAASVAAAPADAALVDAEPGDADPVDAGPVGVGPVHVGPVRVGPVRVGPTESLATIGCLWSQNPDVSRFIALRAHRQIEPVELGHEK